MGATDKPDRFLTVLEFTLNSELGSFAGLGCAVPSYRVQHGKGEYNCSSTNRTKKNGGFGILIKLASVQNLFSLEHS